MPTDKGHHASLKAAVELWKLPQFEDRQIDVPFAKAIARKIREAEADG